MKAENDSLNARSVASDGHYKPVLPFVISFNNNNDDDVSTISSSANLNEKGDDKCAPIGLKKNFPLGLPFTLSANVPFT